MDDPRKVIFLYWGRSGALTRLVQGIHDAALATPGIEPLLCVSRQSDDIASYRRYGDNAVAVDTFSSGIGALTGSWRIPLLRRQVSGMIRERTIDTAITLMPHVWSSFVAPAIRHAGARYVSIVHDAAKHPGDRFGTVNDLLLRDARVADQVITLSDSVREHIAARGIARKDSVKVLFLPEIDYGTRAAAWQPGEPIRLLMLGRIMTYKGLGLLVDALELLRARGRNVTLGVYGSGSINPYSQRLAALGATVVNRWLSDADIAAAVASHHVMALSYTEASQSGVAALAAAAEMPAIATPVGGLREQIRDGVTGVMAAAATAPAFADAVERLIADRLLYEAIRTTLSHSEAFGLPRFVRDLIAATAVAR